MKILCLLILLLTQPSVIWAQKSLEGIKAASIKTMITGCANAALEPNIKRFMEKAKAAGKPFPDEESARKATEQPQVKAVREKARPAMEGMCRCSLEATIKEIEVAKTQLEIEQASKNMKIDRPTMDRCSEKYLPVVQKNLKGP